MGKRMVDNLATVKWDDIQLIDGTNVLKVVSSDGNNIIDTVTLYRNSEI